MADNTLTPQLVLGIEGGATKTEWIYFNHDNGSWTILQQGQLPAANFALISRELLGELLELLPKEATYVGLYFPGVLSSDDHQQLRNLATRIWPSAVLSTGSDLESGFATAFGKGDGILVLSGTGSAVWGRQGENFAKAGGKGHLVGDKGSAYHVAIAALRLVMDRFDEDKNANKLTEAILLELCLNDAADIPKWIHQADKASVARLATVVFKVYGENLDDRDEELLNILKIGADLLAHSTVVVAKKLGLMEPVVALHGSMFTKQDLYVQLYQQALEKKLPTAKVIVCEKSSAIGAAELVVGKGIQIVDGGTNKKAPKKLEEMLDALTEKRNERSLSIDTMTSMELVNLFVEEENKVYEAVKNCQLQLSQAIETVVNCMKKGGHLFYVGAGTSGRLGVLDASEIPPTFGEPPTTVQGIIAGGATALHRSVEGAEDDPRMGAAAILARGVSASDVVCGITASGRTPFVIGALNKAKELGSATLFMTSNPNHQCKDMYNIEIVLATGPELVTGSTRLKAGTATKVALNIITTGAMVFLGKVQSNLMVGMKASNVKLQDRAARLVSQIKKCSYEEAFIMLKNCNWDIRTITK